MARLLAPTTAAGLTSIGAAPHLLPGIFASCPAGHMFEAGKFSFFDRTGTFVYKGMQFAVVGFAAGLVGTALSNVLLSLRKKLDPDFVIQNKSPPTVLNAATWALHMGIQQQLKIPDPKWARILFSSPVASHSIQISCLCSSRPQQCAWRYHLCGTCTIDRFSNLIQNCRVPSNCTSRSSSRGSIFGTSWIGKNLYYIQFPPQAIVWSEKTQLLIQ